MPYKASQRPKKRKRRVPQDAEILNADGAAEALGITTRLLLKLAREGKIPGKKLGKEWRFRRSTILRWLGDPPPIDPAKLTREELLRLLETGEAQLASKTKRRKRR